MNTLSVVAVAIGETAGTLVTTAKPEISCGWEGVTGDLHSGWLRKAEGRVPHYPRGTPMRNERQVTLVSAEELEATARLIGVPRIDFTWLGANILVSGLDRFTALPPTTRIAFPSGAVLVVWNENLPCRGPGEVIQAQFPAQPGLAPLYPKHALHKRGLIAVVERTGAIRAGDEAQIHLPRGMAWMAPDAPWRD